LGGGGSLEAVLEKETAFDLAAQAIASIDSTKSFIEAGVAAPIGAERRACLFGSFAHFERSCCVPRT
jgi:hypothetical protein